MKKILATTLLVSMVGFGGMASAESHGDRHERKGPPPLMERTLEKLPDDKAALVRNFLQEMREGHKEKWQEMKQDREEMRALLTAETFDKEAFLRRAKETHKAKEKAKWQHHEKMAELASKLNAEERRILADAMSERMKHRHPREKGERQAD